MDTPPTRPSGGRAARAWLLLLAWLLLACDDAAVEALVTPSPSSDGGRATPDAAPTPDVEGASATVYCAPGCGLEIDRSRPCEAVRLSLPERCDEAVCQVALEIISRGPSLRLDRLQWDPAAQIEILTLDGHTVADVRPNAIAVLRNGEALPLVARANLHQGRDLELSVRGVGEGWQLPQFQVVRQRYPASGVARLELQPESLTLSARTPSGYFTVINRSPVAAVVDAIDLQGPDGDRGHPSVDDFAIDGCRQWPCPFDPPRVLCGAASFDVAVHYANNDDSVVDIGTVSVVAAGRRLRAAVVGER